MAELDDFRRSPEEMIDFFETLDINDENFDLYERMLRYPDDAFVATINAIKDEKMDIIDTSPEFEGLLENIKSKNNGEIIPSITQESMDKLNVLSKELAKFLNNSSIDKSERDKAKEISNFSQTLVSNLVEESNIEDPYIIVDKDSITKDFRKAASLYQFIKIFPNKEKIEIDSSLSQKDNYIKQETHATGKLVMNLLCPDLDFSKFVIENEDHHITEDNTNKSDELFERFKKEIFTTEGFTYIDKNDKEHTVSYKDLMTICDEVVKEKIDKIN